MSEGKPSKRPVKGMRWRVDQNCRDCIHDEQSGLGNWRQQVGACEITKCPFWEIRAKSKPKKVKLEKSQ